MYSSTNKLPNGELICTKRNNEKQELNTINSNIG